MKITKIAAKREQHAKMKVAAYCRVSTLLDAQQDSLETQTVYYKRYIQANPEWEFVGIYSDERSGTSTKLREGFQAVVQEALDGKIDIILVRSVSRFARNVVDCLKTLKNLDGQGVRVIFEKEHIDSSDPTCFFYLSLMAALAEDESRSISENIAWTKRQKVERGEYNLGNNRIMGYDSVNGKLVPNADAPMIRFVFESYSEGLGLTEISRRLEMLQMGRMRSKKRFTAEQIKYILRNETYVGDKLLQKQAPRDFLTKKPQKNVEYKSNYLTDDHEGIVSRELWDKVQTRLDKTKADAANGLKRCGKRPENDLFGRIFCGCCGAPYRRKKVPTGRKVDGVNEYRFVWVCRERMKGKNGNGCMGRYVREEELSGLTGSVTVMEKGLKTRGEGAA